VREAVGREEHGAVDGCALEEGRRVVNAPITKGERTAFMAVGLGIFVLVIAAGMFVRYMVRGSDADRERLAAVAASVSAETAAWNAAHPKADAAPVERVDTPTEIATVTPPTTTTTSTGKKNAHLCPYAAARAIKAMEKCGRPEFDGLTVATLCDTFDYTTLSLVGSRTCPELDVYFGK
jgi:hypothetical protein